MVTILKNHKKAFVISVISVIAAVLLTAGILYATRPYAVYADGGRVEDPYAVKAGNEEMFLVKDEAAAEKVMEDVLNSYTPEGAQIDSLTIDRKITVEDKKLKRGEEAPLVLREKEAVEYVTEKNSGEDPLFSVTINAQIGTVKNVDSKTRYKESDELYRGEQKVGQKGKDGDQIVTSNVTSVNGKVLTSEVIDRALLNEATDKVIYKGSKEKPEAGPGVTYGGDVMGRGNGAGVANYALQFVGNPYVYGGTSLTHGADCSGFVQSVYRHFGISLPRTVGPQARCGRGVPLSEARPGDLVCYSAHIAIYIGGGNVVHASNSRTGIIVTSAHYSGPVCTVRRIVE